MERKGWVDGQGFLALCSFIVLGTASALHISSRDGSLVSLPNWKITPIASSHLIIVTQDLRINSPLTNKHLGTCLRPSRMMKWVCQMTVLEMTGGV